MRRIVFVMGSMGSGGAERVMSLLANEAVKRGYEVNLLLISSDAVEYSLDNSIKVQFLMGDVPKKRILFAYNRFARLRKCIKRIKPDMVVSFLTTCNIYACLASIGLNVPVIVSERNDPVRECPGKVRRFVRNVVYRLADGYIFQTEDARDHFCARVQAKAIVIPNPVKNNLPVSEFESREKIIVAAARLTQQKNYPMMLAAFAKFLETHPEYRLQIFGKGKEEDALKAYAQSLNISDSVEFMGVVSDLHERIKRASMFVLSSDYEGISNSLLEAMSMGLPCVSTDCPCGGSRHLIQDGVNGLLTPVGDAEAFACAMSRIADSDEFAKHLGNRAIQVRESHATHVILEKYFGFISKIACDKRKQ